MTVNKCLLFNPKWAMFSYLIMGWWYLFCTRPTWWVGIL